MTMPLFLGNPSRDVVPDAPALLGCPLDLTTTYRSGTGKAPGAIRIVSDSIETYSPLLGRDLEDAPFADLGDLLLDGLSLEQALAVIQHRVTEVVGANARPLCIGGEHTITLGTIRALRHFRDDFVVVHLDAHSDLRDSYEGSALNHATVIRRIVELTGPERLIQLGIRAGTRQEFVWMRGQGTLLQWSARGEERLLDRIASRPVYLTLDLDVLDPAHLPATGNPEAGGWSYHDLERFFRLLTQTSLIGADVVELNPALDHAEVATICAAKVVRELILILQTVS